MDPSLTVLGSELPYWISQYGYIALLFLFIVEGPVTGIISGVLISLGLLAFLPVFFLYVIGTLISDSVLYFLFRNGNRKFKKNQLGRWITARLDVLLNKADEQWREKFQDNYFSLMLFSRLAPINLLSQFVVMMAGVTRIPTKKFYAPILIAQPIWSAAIIATGFYFGNVITNPEKMLFESSLIFAGILGLFLLYRRYMHQWVKNGLLGKVFRIDDT
ncbi:MAG: VTT domain-containing protein [Candidatus Paceibacterota bacterium]